MLVAVHAALSFERFAEVLLRLIEPALLKEQAAQVAGYALKSGESAGFLSNVSAFLLLILSWKVLVPRPESGGCCGG